jgi:protein involved in ribonucleotide reduction
MTLVSAPSLVRNGLTYELATKSQKQRMADIQQELEELTGTPRSADVDFTQIPMPMMTPALQKKVQELVDEQNGIIEEVLNGFQAGKYTPAQLADIGQLNGKVREIEADFAEAMADPNLTPAQRKKIKESFEEKLNEATDARNEYVESIGADELSNTFNFDATLGYQIYDTQSATQSMRGIVNNYAKLPENEKQALKDEVQKEAGPTTLTEEDIEVKAREKYIENEYGKRIENGKKNALNYLEEYAKQTGNKINVAGFKTDEEIINHLESLHNDGAISKADLNDGIQKVKDGVFEGAFYSGKANVDGVTNIVVHEGKAARNGRVGVYAHEVLHAVAEAELGDKGAQVAGQKLLDWMSKNDKNLFALVEQRIEQNYTKRSEEGKRIKDKDGNFVKDEAYYEEAMNALSDVLADGATPSAGTLTQARSFVNKLIGGKKKLSINSGADTYLFLRDYNDKAHKGTRGLIPNNILKIAGNKAQQERAKKADQGIRKDAQDSMGKFSQTLSAQDKTNAVDLIERLSERTKAGQKAAESMGRPFDKSMDPVIQRLENRISDAIGPLVSKVVEDRTKALYDKIPADQKRNVSRQDFRESLRSEIETFTVKEYNKEKQDLEKFIVNRAFLRANAIAKDLGIESTETGGIKKDVEAAKGIAAQETTTQTQEAPTYKPLLDRKVFSQETVESVRNTLKTTVRTLTKRMDAPTGKNQSTKAYIAEIENAMKKIAFKVIKDEMGTQENLRKFLTKNGLAIAENLTTTSLQTKMPSLIQKSVGGKYKTDPKTGKKIKDANGETIFEPNFTSNWQGKTIDRAKTSTNKEGKTSGNALVRRLPSLSMASIAEINGQKTKINKASLAALEFMYDDVSVNAAGNVSVGKEINGRKTALSKDMAAELSFEILSEELRNPNSDLVQAFETQQRNLGVELADNYVAELTRDMERGTVKYSKTIRNMSDDKQVSFFARSSELAKALEALNGNFGSTKTVLKSTLKDVYGDLFTTAEYNKISQDLYNVFKPISVEQVKANLWKAETFEEILADIQTDIDWDENVHQLTGATATNAALFRSKEKREIAKENLVKLANDGIITASEVKSFFSPTFANSRRTGDTYKDGSKHPKGDVRSDFFFDVQDIKDAFVGEGRPFTEQEWESAETIPQTANVLMQHINNKYDSDPALRKKDAENADKAWDFVTKIMKALKDMDADTQTMIMSALNSGTNTALRTAAPVVWIVDGLNVKDPKSLRYEHMVPAREILALMYKRYVNGDTSVDMQALKDDYQVALIPRDNNEGFVNMDSIIGEQGFGSRQVYGYVPGQVPNTKRYYNLFTRGVVPYGIRKFGTNEVVGKEYADMYNKVPVFNAEVTLDAKEDMQPSAKYSNSKPRAVFMVGGPGAGKTNVGKGLKLGRRGFKVVNQDLALEPMKEEAGLPANEQQYTKEQRSMRAKLGAAARKAAEAKMEKYKNNGESMVVDGTGASYNATMKKINALRDAGYEVSIVFANTSKEEAIARNKARSERALPDFVVERTWDSVQESAKRYKEEFGDSFYELNTNELKMGQALPKPFLDKLYKDLEVAEAKYSKTLNNEFNEILERTTGIGAQKRFSKVQAELRGAKKGRFRWFVPPGADDFRGLVHYAFSGKGKQGDADMKWFEQKLMDPYFRGVEAINRVRQQIKRDYKATIKAFRPEYKMLNKKIGNSEFTYDQALRVYLWNKQGTNVPGLSKRDTKLLLDAINSNEQLMLFADALMAVSRQNEWSAPTDYWQAQSVLSDLNNMTEKIGRKKFLQEFIENADIIFSAENLNKIEAAFGRAHREAIEDALYSMKNGTNRPSGSNATVNKFINWINGSTGAIMFFNRRSALLQMLSTTNFINWSDNNPVKAAAAFANQKQYWSDWVKIFNSDKLKERRGGLKTDVSESELAAVASRSKNSPQAILAYLLKIGFTPTQIADSLAIASGGASYYRNRVNTYIKEGKSKQEAEEQAWLDFTKKSDETQQSSDPALVSQVQRSVLGRLVFAFANTPMQYTRLMKKAALDLKNGRGDWKSNVSKIAYYGFIQNAIFSALQSGLFALLPGFDDEDEDLTETEAEKKAAKEEAKITRMLNSMLDTVLRGSGVYGAVASTLKNTVSEYIKQEEKGFMADHTYTILAATSISPPINSKLRKIYSAIQTRKFEKDELKERAFGMLQDGRPNFGPGWSIAGNIVSGTLNIPLDRVVDELNAIGEAMDERNTVYQRVALGLGWKTWDVGAIDEEAEEIKAEAKRIRKEEGIKKAKKTREENKKKKEAEEAKEAGDAYAKWREKEIKRLQQEREENNLNAGNN